MDRSGGGLGASGRRLRLAREEALPLLIAHNVAFDRPMMEAHWPAIVTELPCACSQTQIDWARYGFEGAKLFYLANTAGFFWSERHSALRDADAVVELLRQSLDGRTAMAILREAARRPTKCLSIVTRYDAGLITRLKVRGYRWQPGARSWS